VEAIQNKQPWEVQKLYLSKDADNVDENQRPTIVKELEHIHLLSLNVLFLWGNQIQSIEGLARLHMPFVEELNLCTLCVKKLSTASPL
jgi:hypothetical protein